MMKKPTAAGKLKASRKDEVARVTKQEVSKKPAAKTKVIQHGKPDDNLIFKDPYKERSVRYFKGMTIYTDTVRCLWRIKPGPGRRDDTKVMYKRGAEEAWDVVVHKIRQLAKK